MSTKAVFTMKLEPDLRDYIEQRRHERAYSEYLGRKVGNVNGGAKPSHWAAQKSATLARG